MPFEAAHTYIVLIRNNPPPPKVESQAEQYKKFLSFFFDVMP